MGGGPEGALQWHFLAMWILVANGIAYLAYGLSTGRFRRMLLPIRIAEIIAEMRSGLGAQARPRRPHALQRGAARALRRHHRRRHPAGALGPGDLEARAVLRARDSLLRLPGRAPRALPGHGRHRRLPRRARGPGADRAEDPGRHDDRRSRRAARRTGRAQSHTRASPASLRPEEARAHVTALPFAVALQAQARASTRACSRRTARWSRASIGARSCAAASASAPSPCSRAAT